MDRNDHYGGASSSLNLMQVILDMHIHSPSSFLLQRNTSILMSSDLFIYLFCFLVFLVKTLFFCFIALEAFQGK